jgi:hypothetical protein
MYTLTGAVEDVTTTAPVNFSDFFQECPWQIGCSSFLSIQATAYGLVWLAGDLTVNIFDGTDAPQDISMSVYPILRQITAGYANLAVGCQFNWKERDWYCLLFPFAGSTVNNYAIFFSLDKVHNEIEIFPSSIPAQFIGNITTSTLQKVLAIAQGTGRIWNLPVESDTDGGLIQTPPVTPTTSGILPAYWTSGYFGNDQAQRSKSWRAAFIVMDPTIAAIAAIAGPPVPWSANVYLVGDVNDQVRTFQNPQVVAAAIVGNRIPIDYRANRCAIQIVFPPQDMSCSVLELTVDNIATSDRV